MKPYYEENGIAIYHGDCREILPTLEPVDLVLTDPPYGMNALDGTRTQRKYGINRQDNWDIFPPDHKAIQLCLNAGRDSIIWGMNYLCNVLPPHKGTIVWFKPHVAHLPNRSDVEIAYSSLTIPATLISMIADRNLAHPAQKPLALIKHCIRLAKSPQSVLDPFMGSGTTLRAAKDLGLSAIGIEIEEKYCEIAAERLRQQVLSFDSPAVPSARNAALFEEAI